MKKKMRLALLLLGVAGMLWATTPAEAMSISGSQTSGVTWVTDKGVSKVNWQASTNDTLKPKTARNGKYTKYNDSVGMKENYDDSQTSKKAGGSSSGGGSGKKPGTLLIIR